jgi:cysteine desulfurase / selenocysteine lyase
MSASFLQAPASFDAYAVRSEFPILARQVNGYPLTYLDSAASAQKPACVIDGMAERMRTSYANVHRGLHTLANETTQSFEAARKTMARFLNAARADEVIFTSGTTGAINLLASGIGASLQAGDEIILSDMEHHSNIVPWHFLRTRKGVVIKWVDLLDDGRLDMQSYARAFSDKTRFVALSHMSNVTGIITDAKALVELAHAHDVPILLDGSQAAVHFPVDVQALDVDFYAVTGHKLYGPTGIGALYGKAERLNALPPWQGGGEMIESVSRDSISYALPPHRFEAGTPPILQAIGLGHALEWMMAQDRTAIGEHETLLAKQTAEGLGRYNDVRILGDAPDKGAIVSFDVKGMHAHDLAQLMDRYGVAVRAGNHCAEPLMRRFSAVATCRASFAAYNTIEDVDRFLEAFAKAREFLS